MFSFLVDFRPGAALAVFAFFALAWQGAAADGWLPLASDGIHDPASPAVKQLQEPAQALAKLPKDTAGNLVRWVQAIDSGAIAPRMSLRGESKPKVLDQDILLSLRGGMPIVRFPHRVHSLILDCANCHEALFKSKTGSNPISMLQILQGEQCGLCHGAVAFPLTECDRCHSVPRPNGTPANAAQAQP